MADDDRNDWKEKLALLLGALLLLIIVGYVCSHSCPAGAHWDYTKNCCVDDATGNCIDECWPKVSDASCPARCRCHDPMSSCECSDCRTEGQACSGGMTLPVLCCSGLSCVGGICAHTTSCPSGSEVPPAYQPVWGSCCPGVSIWLGAPDNCCGSAPGVCLPTPCPLARQVPPFYQPTWGACCAIGTIWDTGENCCMGPTGTCASVGPCKTQEEVCALSSECCSGLECKPDHCCPANSEWDPSRVPPCCVDATSGLCVGACPTERQIPSPPAPASGGCCPVGSKWDGGQACCDDGTGCISGSCLPITRQIPADGCCPIGTHWNSTSTPPCCASDATYQCVSTNCYSRGETCTGSATEVPNPRICCNPLVCVSGDRCCGATETWNAARSCCVDSAGDCVYEGDAGWYCLTNGIVTTPCNGNGNCEPGERCPCSDCSPCCGDGNCDAGETCSSCPGDCSCPVSCTITASPSNQNPLRSTITVEYTGLRVGTIVSMRCNDDPFSPYVHVPVSALGTVSRICDYGSTVGLYHPNSNYSTASCSTDATVPYGPAVSCTVTPNPVSGNPLVSVIGVQYAGIAAGTQVEMRCDPTDPVQTVTLSSDLSASISCDYGNTPGSHEPTSTYMATTCSATAVVTYPTVGDCTGLTNLGGTQGGAYEYCRAPCSSRGFRYQTRIVSLQASYPTLPDSTIVTFDCGDGNTPSGTVSGGTASASCTYSTTVRRNYLASSYFTDPNQRCSTTVGICAGTNDVCGSGSCCSGNCQELVFHCGGMSCTPYDESTMECVTGPPCQDVGEECRTNGECCSHSCDFSVHLCASGTIPVEETPSS